MPYTPPANNAVNFTLTAYTPPANNAVSFDVTGSLVAAVSGTQPRQFGDAIALASYSATASGGQLRQFGDGIAQVNLIADVSGGQSRQIGTAAALMSYAAAVEGTQPRQFGNGIATQAYMLDIAGVQPRQSGTATAVSRPRPLQDFSVPIPVESSIAIYWESVLNAAPLTTTTKHTWDDYTDEAWDDLTLTWGGYPDKRLLSISFTFHAESSVQISPDDVYWNRLKSS